MLEQESPLFNGLERSQSLITQGLPALGVASLRKELSYITAELVSKSKVRFPNVFARIEFLCRRFHLPNKVRQQLHQLRRSHPDDENETEEQFKIFASALAYLIQAATQSAPPATLALTEIPEITFVVPEGQHIPKLRAQVVSIENEVLMVVAEDEAFGSFSLARKDHPQYERTWEQVNEDHLLSLVDVRLDDGKAVARLIVLMPDYLVDVSSLAECFQRLAFKNIGAPALYFINRFSQRQTSEPLFLGNLINSLLDKILHDQDNREFKDFFRESFGDFPLEYITLFQTDEALLSFMRSRAFPQYANLKRVVSDDLSRLTPPVVPSKAMLEPSFMSPDLGLQGRLDLLYLRSNKAVIIELKSGKVPWPPEDLDAVGENHSAQARLYRMILQEVLGVRPDSSQVYVLYSSAMHSGSNLRFVARYAEFEQQMMDVRNEIVAYEHQLASAESADEIIDIMLEWNYASCNIPENARIPGFFIGKFKSFEHAIHTLSTGVVKDYFAAYLSFIVKEQWTARLGDGQHRKGHSTLWNREDTTENDSTGIIAPLEIVSNDLSSQKPSLTLNGDKVDLKESDFRKGDIIVLYPYADSNSKATDQQVIKGYIAEEFNAGGDITLGFRYPQQCHDYFEQFSYWAIEHDYMDHTFQVMQRELFSFCTEPSSLRRLILEQEEPVSMAAEGGIELLPHEMAVDSSVQELRSQLTKAIHAQDYFLLIGPPGTGKTSLFLRNLVHNALVRGERLLLLAYTNRAVDELSQAVLDLCDDGSFMRVGSGIGCAPQFEPFLMHRIAGESRNRKELTQRVLEKRVIVSTVSSMLNRPQIFQLLKFDRIIVDEAAQVLEPMLINLLRRAPKFVLIGDHKQLPAVVTHKGDTKAMLTEELEQIGMTDLRNSLFERLLIQAQTKGWDHAWGQLNFQGRMHPSLMEFPNERWYGQRLRIAQRSHQLEPDRLSLPAPLDHRLLFVDSRSDAHSDSKHNPIEVHTISHLVEELIKQDVPEAQIGVIAPYRAQVVAIKSQLNQLSYDTSKVVVDTVERFQGGQKDHILYGTTISNWTQLRFLASHRNEDENQVVDRKLNVAFTRARKQFILIGNEELLKEDEEYQALIEYIRSSGKVLATSALVIKEDTVNTPF
ncbi:MAG: AAA domain-containing protein [Flavobacteriales bacterium]|nr:AAA domain-containing protein [Flavobacteriales bacterium]